MTWLLAINAGGATLPLLSEGQVRFYNIADTDFDRYSRQPGDAMQAFMREHYARMQVYSPYFDERTSWYPNGWVYKDSYALKPHWPEFDGHPEWVLRDENGVGLYIPWGCVRGACPQFAADVGNPGFRAHWINAARAIVDRGYRGIWVDDVNLAWRVGNGEGEFVRPIDPRTGRHMTLEDWQRNFARFMEEIRAAFPGLEIAHNAIWYADSFDDPEVRRQIRAADYINLERGASDSGLRGGNGRFGFERFLSYVDLVHAEDRGVILMDYGKTTKQRDFGLAAWFLISSGVDLISTNQLKWSAPASFWPGYRLHLGKAAGTRYVWNGLLRRDFERGSVLLNQPGARAVTVTPPYGARLAGGHAAPNKLRLEAAEGVILVTGESGDQY